nr:DeoR/GlpR family DNA-binding transcription regulator [uncultured Anaerostipes sp.]
MFVEERQQKILELLHENQKVKVKELSQMFKVTEDCIRKDLTSMEGRHLLKRAYGGAVLAESQHPGHTNAVSSRKEKNLKEKQRIAKKAVKLIKDGDVVFLDTSTTNLELAREIIRTKRQVTVVSCMLDIANVFAAGGSTGFILLGGEFNRSQIGFLGNLTLSMMENFRFDLCFMGVVGADVMENAITTYVPEDGAMKQSAISKSRRSYLMMETKKFDFQANYVFADFTQIDGVICETEPSEQVRAALKEFGTEIIV